jgi:uncharacterized membrane protein required for colicin V production
MKKKPKLYNHKTPPIAKMKELSEDDTKKPIDLDKKKKKDKSQQIKEYIKNLKEKLKCNCTVSFD